MSDVAFPVARSIYHVPIALIDAEGGLRPLDPVWVEALTVLMGGESGQETPIEIWPKANGRYGMTAGRHRLAAAKALGWTAIDADILDRKGLDRRAREVSENLFKLGLSPLDRAAFVAEQIAIEKARAGVAADASPQSVAATARWADRIGAEADDACATMAHAFGFTDDVAEKVGLSRRAIYRDLELHRGLRPDVVETVRTLPLANNATQLRALARLPEREQREVAELLVEGGAKGVTDAVALLKGRVVPDAAQKAWSAFTGSWGRMSRPMQRLALIEILRHSGTAPELRALLTHLDGGQSHDDGESLQRGAGRPALDAGAGTPRPRPGRGRAEQGGGPGRDAPGAGLSAGDGDDAGPGPIALASADPDRAPGNAPGNAAQGLTAAAAPEQEAA
ncbi:ParB N-terminal domain-containing protein [Rhizobium sp. CRIBSB]|nr:ParB N-terminal domain-containing protein [Rhizobium sp. CRIBSB]